MRYLHLFFSLSLFLISCDESLSPRNEPEVAVQTLMSRVNRITREPITEKRVYVDTLKLPEGFSLSEASGVSERVQQGANYAQWGLPLAPEEYYLS